MTIELGLLGRGIAEGEFSVDWKERKTEESAPFFDQCLGYLGTLEGLGRALLSLRERSLLVLAQDSPLLQSRMIRGESAVLNLFAKRVGMIKSSFLEMVETAFLQETGSPLTEKDRQLLLCPAGAAFAKGSEAKIHVIVRSLILAAARQEGLDKQDLYFDASWLQNHFFPSAERRAFGGEGLFKKQLLGRLQRPSVREKIVLLREEAQLQQLLSLFGEKELFFLLFHLSLHSSEFLLSARLMHHFLRDETLSGPLLINERVCEFFLDLFDSLGFYNEQRNREQVKRRLVEGELSSFLFAQSYELFAKRGQFAVIQAMLCSPVAQQVSNIQGWKEQLGKALRESRLELELVEGFCSLIEEVSKRNLVLAERALSLLLEELFMLSVETESVVCLESLLLSKRFDEGVNGSVLQELLQQKEKSREVITLYCDLFVKRDKETLVKSLIAAAQSGSLQLVQSALQENRFVSLPLYGKNSLQTLFFCFRYGEQKQMCRLMEENWGVKECNWFQRASAIDAFIAQTPLFPIQQQMAAGNALYHERPVADTKEQRAFFQLLLCLIRSEKESCLLEPFFLEGKEGERFSFSALLKSDRALSLTAVELELLLEEALKSFCSSELIHCLFSHEQAQGISPFACKKLFQVALQQQRVSDVRALFDLPVAQKLERSDLLEMAEACIENGAVGFLQNLLLKTRWEQLSDWDFERCICSCIEKGRESCLELLLLERKPSPSKEKIYQFAEQAVQAGKSHALKVLLMQNHEKPFPTEYFALLAVSSIEKKQRSCFEMILFSSRRAAFSGSNISDIMEAVVKANRFDLLEPLLPLPESQKINEEDLAARISEAEATSDPLLYFFLEQLRKKLFPTWKERVRGLFS